MPVTSDYDFLIAKVIAWGKDRNHAIRRLQRALDEFQVGGVSTDIELLSQIVESSGFEAGWTDTTYLDNFKAGSVEEKDSMERELALAAAMVAHQSHSKTGFPERAIPDGSLWRMAAWREQMHHID